MKIKCLNQEHAGVLINADYVTVYWRNVNKSDSCFEYYKYNESECVVCIYILCGDSKNEIQIKLYTKDGTTAIALKSKIIHKLYEDDMIDLYEYQDSKEIDNYEYHRQTV